MPSRVALAPRARPLERPVRAGLLPQREVLRVPLVRVDLELLPVPGAQPVQGVARELAVAGERGDVVVDGAVDLVGVALLDQRLDDLDHVVDVLGGARAQVGTFDPDQVGVLQERIGVLPGDLGRGQPLVGLGKLHLVSAGVRDLVGHVSDVCDVHDPVDPLPLQAKRAADQVTEHERPHVADVDVPVYGRPARVDLHRLPVDGGDVVQLTREGVVQAHGHASIASLRATSVPSRRTRYPEGDPSGRGGVCVLPLPEPGGPPLPLGWYPPSALPPCPETAIGTSIGSRSPSSAIRISISSPTSSSRSRRASRTPSTTWRFLSRRLRTLSRHSFSRASTSLRRSRSPRVAPIASSIWSASREADMRLLPIPYIPMYRAALSVAAWRSDEGPDVTCPNQIDSAT